MTTSKNAPLSLRRALDGYLREVVAEVWRLCTEDTGRRVLGLVAGRPESEDVEIGIDRFCEDLLEKWLKTAKTRIDLHSEHSLRHIGGTTKPRYLVTCDPFDGSGHFMRGIPGEWWSVLTFWDVATLTPVLAGAADIGRRELYIADADGVTVESLVTGDKHPVRPAQHTALSDRSVLSAYLMAPAYIATWTDRAAALLRVLRERHPKARIWTDGGACSYPWLARGITHAYIMFNEPRSEIDPGLGFAWAANLGVYSVAADGALTDYRFVPGESSGRVPWLIAACTRPLAQDIARAILKG
jgi:fructose-1,6-bisphosphatase/inositol monophosphatase family enzyme